MRVITSMISTSIIRNKQANKEYKLSSSYISIIPAWFQSYSYNGTTYTYMIYYTRSAYMALTHI